MPMEQKTEVKASCDQCGKTIAYPFSPDVIQIDLRSNVHGTHARFVFCNKAHANKWWKEAAKEDLIKA